MGKDIRDIFLLIKNKAMGGKPHREMGTLKASFLGVSKFRGHIFQRKGISSQFWRMKKLNDIFIPKEI